jgi:hypothetical protein
MHGQQNVKKKKRKSGTHVVDQKYKTFLVVSAICVRCAVLHILRPKLCRDASRMQARIQDAKDRD